MKTITNKTSKTILLVIMSLFFVVVTVNAQDNKDSDLENPIGKGRILLDVDFAILSTDSKVKDANSTTIDSKKNEFDFHVGYAIIDNLIISLGLVHDDHDLTAKNQYYKSVESAKSNLFTLSTTYFFLEGNKFRPFAGVGYGFGKGETDSLLEITGVPTTNSVTESNLNGFVGTVGLAYFINTHIGMEVLYSYSSLNHEDKDNNPNTEDFTTIGSHIGLGVTVSF